MNFRLLAAPARSCPRSNSVLVTKYVNAPYDVTPSRYLVRVLVLAACFKNEREIRTFMSVLRFSYVAGLLVAGKSAQGYAAQNAIRGAALACIGVRFFQVSGQFAFLRQFARFPQLTLAIPLQHPVSNIIWRIEAAHLRATGPRQSSGVTTIEKCKEGCLYGSCA